MENTQMMKTNSKELLRFCVRVLVFVVFCFTSYSYAQVFSKGATIYNREDIIVASTENNLPTKDFYITKNAFVHFGNQNSNAYTPITSEQKNIVNKKNNVKKKKTSISIAKNNAKIKKYAIKRSIIFYTDSNHNSSHFANSNRENNFAILAKSNTISVADIITKKENIICDMLKYFYPKYFYHFYTSANVFSIAIRPPPIA